MNTTPPTSAASSRAAALRYFHLLLLAIGLVSAVVELWGIAAQLLRSPRHK